MARAAVESRLPCITCSEIRETPFQLEMEGGGALSCGSTSHASGQAACRQRSAEGSPPQHVRPAGPQHQQSPDNTLAQHSTGEVKDMQDRISTLNSGD